MIKLSQREFNNTNMRSIDVTRQKKNQPKLMLEMAVAAPPIQSTLLMLDSVLFIAESFSVAMDVPLLATHANTCILSLIIFFLCATRIFYLNKGIVVFSSFGTLKNPDCMWIKIHCPYFGIKWVNNLAFKFIGNTHSYNCMKLCLVMSNICIRTEPHTYIHNNNRYVILYTFIIE